MEYIQEITLDLNTHSAPLIVGAKQNDVDSRILHIQFTKNGEDYSINTQHSIAFRLRKPDSHFILNSGKINSDGTVDITLTKQCLLAAGRGYADVVESNSTGVLSTAAFILDIQPNAGGNEIEEKAISSDEFNYLTDFILRGNEIIGDSEKWAVGTKNGDPIDSSDPAYNNYSEYWSEQANAWANGQIKGSDISSGPQKNNNAKYWAEEAENSRARVEAMSATAEMIPMEEIPIVEKTENQQGGVNFHFKLPHSNPIFCTFDINLTSGQLFVYCPDYDTYMQDLNFEVNETTGQLEVSFNE